MRWKGCHLCETACCLLCSGRDLAKIGSSNMTGRAAWAHWDMSSVYSSCKSAGSHLYVQGMQGACSVWMQSVWCKDHKCCKSKALSLITNGGTTFSLVYEESWGDFVFHWRIPTLCHCWRCRKRQFSPAKYEKYLRLKVVEKTVLLFLGFMEDNAFCHFPSLHAIVVLCHIESFYTHTCVHICTFINKYYM